ASGKSHPNERTARVVCARQVVEAITRLGRSARQGRIDRIMRAAAEQEHPPEKTPNPKPFPRWRAMNSHGRHSRRCFVQTRFHPATVRVRPSNQTLQSRIGFVLFGQILTPFVSYSGGKVKSREHLFVGHVPNISV